MKYYTTENQGHVERSRNIDQPDFDSAQSDVQL